MGTSKFKSSKCCWVQIKNQDVPKSGPEEPCWGGDKVSVVSAGRTAACFSSSGQRFLPRVLIYFSCSAQWNLSWNKLSSFPLKATCSFWNIPPNRDNRKCFISLLHKQNLKKNLFKFKHSVSLHILCLCYMYIFWKTFLLVMSLFSYIATTWDLGLLYLHLLLPNKQDFWWAKIILKHFPD